MRSPIGFLRQLTLLPQGLTMVIAGFLPIFAIVSMFPALPGIIDHFRDNPSARELVPLMVSAPGLTIALVAPFAGWFVDRFGRLKLMIWATFFYGLFGTAPFFLNDLSHLFASRLALGVCEAFILTIVNTLIGDYWEDKARRDWLFLQGLLGPALASMVILVAGTITELRWNAIFLIYGFAFVIALAMKLFLFEPAPEQAPQSAAPLATPPAASPFPLATMVRVGAVTLFASALYYVFIISGSLVFREVGVIEPSRIGELTAIPSLFIIVGAALFLLLGKRSNAVQLGAFFFVLSSGLIGLGLARSVPVLLVFLALQQTGAGMAVPSLIAWVQTKLPFEHRGRGMGIWTACFFFGQFSSPWLVSRVEGMAGSTQAAFAALGACGLALGIAALAKAFASRNAAPMRP